MATNLAIGGHCLLAMYRFGYGLHAIQDFYSHMDLSAP